MSVKILKYKLKPEVALDEEAFHAFMQPKVGAAESGKSYQLIKRSIDARARKVMVNVEVAVFQTGTNPYESTYQLPDVDVASAPGVVIIGAGPAGLFAALRCIELGAKPIVLERGKDVRERRRDLAKINKEHTVNPDSNYCFGEGGAGTYSDGKLYTRSKKRGDVRRILEILVAHGATENILVDTHPHIGTNKLPRVIASMREAILAHGGEIHFDTRVTDLLLDNGVCKGVTTAAGHTFEGEGVLLATGHSARDIFHLLAQKKIHIAAKPFALGVRIEHAQQLIDRIQYHCDHRGEYLPAAPYSLTTQTDLNKQTKGVFSFCMCPGGFIVPSATSPGEVVVNGMSPSKRDSRFANSGIVVAVDEKDFLPYGGSKELSGMMFQAAVEQKACEVAGGTQQAPAQRMVDFVEGRLSSTLPECSYQPGLSAVSLDDVLPEDIAQRLKMGFRYFGRKMKGYLTNEAVLVGVESRTSSPVSIPRNRETMEHIEVQRLFPCGEGAGYAGGIMSAAIDGEKCAEMLVRKYILKD